jgi:hypothetical protein
MIRRFGPAVVTDPGRIDEVLDIAQRRDALCVAVTTCHRDTGGTARLRRATASSRFFIAHRRRVRPGRRRSSSPHRIQLA